MNEIKRINKAKKLVYVTSVLQFQGFIGPVLFVFYTYYMGLSTAQYLIADALLFFVMAIAEIPSGMIADSIGRKKVLVLSKVAIIFGMVLLLITKSFGGAIIVAIIYGIFGAMESGIIGSNIYELFYRNDLIKEYELIGAKSSSIAFFVSVIYAILSGYLVELNYALPVILDLIISIITLILIIYLLDDKKDYEKRNILSSFPKKQEFNNIFPIIAIASLLLCFSRTIYSFYQPILLSLKFPLYLLGYASACYSIICGISATFYKKIRTKLTSDQMMSFIIIIQLICSVGMFLINSLAIVFFILLQQFQRAIMAPFFYMQVNGYISNDSKNRVTIMSIYYFLTTILSCCLLFLSSKIIEHKGIETSIAVISIIINILVILSWLLLSRKKRKGRIVYYIKE